MMPIYFSILMMRFINKLRHLCMAQQFNLKKGLREFGVEGVQASKAKLKQMHDRGCWRTVAVNKLTRRERLRAQEGLMLLTRKRSGSCKGRLAFNGKPTRAWLGKEDKKSPTVLTESLFITCAIDAWETNDVMSMDIPNTYTDRLT